MAAIYSNYPAYRAAVEKVQKLNSRLNGNFGLVEAMNTIVAKKGESSPEYIKVKKEFDKVQVEYEAAVASAKTMRQTIDAQDLKKSTEKNASKKKITDNADVKVLEFQRDSLKRQNKVEEAAAKQAEIDAIRNPVTEKEKVADNTITQGGTEENPYGGYTLSAIDGNVYGPGDGENNGLEGVFVPTRNDKGELVNEFITNSGSQAVKNFLKEYTKPGQIAALQKQLLDSDYIKQSDIAGDTWTAGVLDMLKAYSRDYVSKFQFEGITDLPTIDVFMQSKKAGGKTGGSKSYSTITKRGDAKKELDEYLIDLRGTTSTPEEEEAYYKKLRAAEQKAVLTIGDGFTTGQKLDQADHILIAVEVAKKSLKGTDVEKLLASGGQAALDIADLQEYSANYGIEMSAADALKYVATGLGQKDYISKQQERIRQTAITLNPQLKDHFLAGGTYTDIANQYKNAKQRKLGITITDSLKDKDITDAISKGVSINDFNTQLQGKSEWRKTPEANSMVDGFINKLGEMWGLG